MTGEHDASGSMRAQRKPLDVPLLIVDALRFLAFRTTSAQLHTHAGAYLGFGLLVTWLAGVGRYWDSPRAELWQQLGLGSLAYVVLLAAWLWVLVWPLRPQRCSYLNTLLFVTLCAPPALLYAIPVERFLAIHEAQAANVWFLALVAVWRVALLVTFLVRVAALSWPAVAITTLLPIALIVVALSALNLEHVVFRIMAGIQESEISSNDSAYGVVVLLSVLSILASPFLLVGYLVLVYLARKR